MRVVDVAMLIGQAVTGIVDHILDAGVQLVDVFHAPVLGRHVRAMLDGVGPHEARDGGLHRIGARRQGLQRRAVARLAATVIGARQADLADQARQGHDRPGRPLTVAAALRAPALADEQRLGGADLFSQLLDLLLGDTGDLGSPRRRLLHLVVAHAHDVIEVGHVLALICLGHGLLVKAHAVGVQEVHIAHVVLNQVMGDTRDQRGVGAGIDGQPLVGMAHDGVVHARVDHIDLRTGLLAQLDPIVMSGKTALARFGGAGAEHEDELGILGVLEGAAAIVLGAVHVRGDGRDLGSGVIAVAIQAAAQHVQQSIERTSRGCGNAGRIRQVHGLVAILFDNLFELRGCQIDSLVPRDALELALAALADALHGVVDAIGMVHPTTIRTATQARTGLRVVEAGVLARAGVHPHNLIVLHMELQAAAARAVDGAMAPRDLLLGLRECRLGCAEQVRARCSGAADGGQSTQRTRRLDERAAVHAWHVLHCLPLHSFLFASAETAALSRAATRLLPFATFSPRTTLASLVGARLPSKRIW